MSTPIVTPNLLQQLKPVQAPALPTAPLMPSMPQLPGVAAPIVSKIPTAMDLDQKRVNDLHTQGSGIDQIHNPLLRGLARTADIAGSVFGAVSPIGRVLDMAIPGTTLHHQVLVNQAERNLANDQATQKAADESAQSQAVTGHTDAAADLTKQQTLGLPQQQADTHELAQANVGNTNAEEYMRMHPLPDYELHDTPSGILKVNKKDGAAQYVTVDGHQVGAPIKTTKVQLKIGGVPHEVLVNEQTGDPIKDLGESGFKPQNINLSTGTWSPGFDADKNPVMFNSKTGEVKPMSGTFTKQSAATAKIGADEQKRADLAQNMNENINKLEEILQRRPDLFGPIAGRMTQGKVAFGTGDEDAATLMTIEHQLGMVAQGAHGMRSAQGVESAANSLTNGFKNSPNATRAALEAARQSVSTFLSDSQNAGQPRSAEAPSSGLAVSLKDAMNLLQNKGKSEAAVKADIQAHGHAVKP